MAPNNAEKERLGIVIRHYNFILPATLVHVDARARTDRQTDRHTHRHTHKMITV